MRPVEQFMNISAVSQMSSQPLEFILQSKP